MTKTIEMWEEYWYLAFQDGRADNQEYETKEEATKALKKLPKDLRRGICIMSNRRRLA